MTLTNRTSMEAYRHLKMANGSVINGDIIKGTDKLTDKQRNKIFTEEHGKNDNDVEQTKMLDLKSKVLKKVSSKVIRRDTWAGPTDSRMKDDNKTQEIQEFHNTSGHKVKKKDSVSGKGLLDKKNLRDKNEILRKSAKSVGLPERNKTKHDEGPVRRSRLELYENSKTSNGLPQVSSEIERQHNEKNATKEAPINSLVLENNIRKRDSYKRNDIEAACEIHLNSIYNNMTETENNFANRSHSDKETSINGLKTSESHSKESNVTNMEEHSNNIVTPKSRKSQTEDLNSTEIYIDTQNGQIRVKPGEKHSLTSLSDMKGTKVLIQQRDVTKSTDGQKLPCSIVDDNQSTQEEVRDIFGLTELNTVFNRQNNVEVRTHQTSISPFALVKDCNSEVEFWLHGLGLPDVENYVKIFADHEIDLLDLEFMTAAQLHDMGITALGALDKILKGVKDLRSDGQTKLSKDDKGPKRSKQLPLSSIAWEADGGEILSKSKSSARKSVESDSKLTSSGKSLTRISSKTQAVATKSFNEEERSSSAMSVHSDGGESILSSRSKVTNPSFFASTKSSNAKCVAKRPPTSKAKTQSKSKTQKVNEKRNDSNVPDKAGFRLSQMEGKPTKSVLLRQRSSSLNRDNNSRQARKEKEEKEDKDCNIGHDVKGRSRNLRYRSRSADAVKRKALEGVQSAAKKFEERVQRDKDNKQTFNLTDERVKAKRDEMAARHLQREKHKELMVDQSSDTEEDTSLPAVYTPRVDDESLESLVTVNILSQSGPLRQPTKRPNDLQGGHSDTGTVIGNMDVKKGLRRVEPAKKPISKQQKMPNGIQLNTAKASPIKSKIGGPRESDKSPRSQSEPESGYKTDGSTSYTQIEDRVTEIQGKIKRLKARAGSGDDLTGTLVHDLQAQLQQFQQILGTRNQAKHQSTIGSSNEARLQSDSPGRQSQRGLRRSASFELPKASPIEEVLAEDETMNKDIKDDKIVRMSKRELLDEMRKEKKNHHLQIRQLQKELERIKHADPVTSMEIQLSEIIYKKEDLIGEGTFSQVYKGLYQGSEVAVKKMKVPLRSQDKNYFTAELSLLKELRHPRVVLLIGVCTTDKHPVMVLEYMSRGSLYHYLHDSSNESLDHALYFQVARDVTAGMKYLHSHRPEVIHLDLKSMNVLLCQSYRAKIADFGFSKLRHDAGVKSKTRGKQTNISSPAWMSPELLNKGEVTTKTDVYSFGVILWEMLTRQEPYNNLSVFQILERVRKNRRPEIPVSAPEGLQLLISQCWDPNPAKRPQFKDILLLLENLEFPPAWRELFRKAGVPDEALSNVHSTRNIIKLVTDMLELKTLPNFMLKVKSSSSLDTKRSARNLSNEPNVGTDKKRTDVEGEVDRDNWDIETVTTLSGDELSDESDVTIQELNDSSADESLAVSSESNDERSVTSDDFASTVVSVDSQRVKKRPVNVFIPSLELSIESARKEFTAERDRISRSSWMSISLDDRTGSSQENYTGRHDENRDKNKQSETSLNLSSNRSARSSIHSSREDDVNFDVGTKSSTSKGYLSNRSTSRKSNDFEQDYNTKHVMESSDTSYGPSSDRMAKSVSSKEKDRNMADGSRTIYHERSSRSEAEVPSLHQLSNRSYVSSVSESRISSLHQLSNRSDRSSSPSSVVLSESAYVNSLARSRRRSRNTQEILGKSNEYQMRESFNNMRPPSPKKRVSITKKLMDKSWNSESDSARSKTLTGVDNTSSIQSLPISANVDSSYDSFFGIQSTRKSLQKLQTCDNAKRSTDLNMELITKLKSLNSSFDSSSQTVSSDSKIDKDLNSVKRSQVYIVTDEPGISPIEGSHIKIDKISETETNLELKDNFSKPFEVPFDLEKGKLDKSVEEGKQVEFITDNNIVSTNSSHSNRPGSKNHLLENARSMKDPHTVREQLRESCQVFSQTMNKSQIIKESSLESNQNVSNVNTPKESLKVEASRSEEYSTPDLSCLSDPEVEKNSQTNFAKQKAEQVSINNSIEKKKEIFKQSNNSLQRERPAISKLVKSTEIKHDGGEEIRKINKPTNIEKKKPAITPRKSKLKSTQDSQHHYDSGNLITKSQTIESEEGYRLAEQGKQSEPTSKLAQAIDGNNKETQTPTDNVEYNSVGTEGAKRKDSQEAETKHCEHDHQKYQKSSKIRVKLRKDPLAVKVTRDCPSPVPPAPPPPPPPMFNLSKSMSAVGKSVQVDPPRLSIADELKHKISQRQSISEGIKVMRKESGHSFKPVKSENMIGSGKQSHTTSMQNSNCQIGNETPNMVTMSESDSLLVPQQSEGLPSFVVQSMELQDQKEHLRSISKPHPDQLDDLSGASQEQLSSIADILRKAVMGRRVAMREDGDSVSQSCDSIATGWSVDLT